MSQAASIIQALGAPFVFVILLLMMISGTVPLIALWILLRKSDERFMALIEKGDERYQGLLERVMENMDRAASALASYRAHSGVHEVYEEDWREKSPPHGYRKPPPKKP